MNTELKKLQAVERAKRAAARMAVSWCIRDGTLKRMPCRVCGELLTEAHHPDYDEPLEIIWLCRSHHVAAHGKKPQLGNPGNFILIPPPTDVPALHELSTALKEFLFVNRLSFRGMADSRISTATLNRFARGVGGLSADHYIAIYEKIYAGPPNIDRC